MSSSTQNTIESAIAPSDPFGPEEYRLSSPPQPEDKNIKTAIRPEHQPGIINTQEFQEWFAGSQVIDGFGAPLICYYGIASDSKTIGRCGNGTYAQLGYWFDALPRLVESYGLDHTSQRSPNLIPAYLSIRNPKEYSGMETFHDAANAKYGPGPQARFQRLRKDLKKAGYDGVVVRNCQETGGVTPDYWVAFWNRQIRVALCM